MGEKKRTQGQQLARAVDLLMRAQRWIGFAHGSLTDELLKNGTYHPTRSHQAAAGQCAEDIATFLRNPHG